MISLIAILFKRSFTLHLFLIYTIAYGLNPNDETFDDGFNKNPLIFPGEEKYFRDLKQLTFSGVNAEAYFSSDGDQITFQAINYGYNCDQIFRFSNVTFDDMSSKKPQLISTGLGRTTCSYFFPDDDQVILYASTHATSPDCPLSACSPEMTGRNSTLKELCLSVRYVWDVFPSYDIYLAYSDGVLKERLTDEYGYDAEGTVSPIGDKIVYTSMASGDLELWTMNLDGGQKRQITTTLGYDGGAFFSPDGRKLIFRASRPKTQQEIDLYKKLLSYNLVSPLRMEIYEADLTTPLPEIRQITNFGGSNWAPFYHPDGCHVIFSSNFENPASFNFQLYMINTCSDLQLRKITNGTEFNSFPMFNRDGTRLIFGSNRNSTTTGDQNFQESKFATVVGNGINLFVAKWNNQWITEKCLEESQDLYFIWNYFYISLLLLCVCQIMVLWLLL